jgi:hypothetical protein
MRKLLVIQPPRFPKSSVAFQNWCAKVMFSNGNQWLRHFTTCPWKILTLSRNLPNCHRNRPAMALCSNFPFDPEEFLISFFTICKHCHLLYPAYHPYTRQSNGSFRQYLNCVALNVHVQEQYSPFASGLRDLGVIP